MWEGRDGEGDGDVGRARWIGRWRYAKGEMGRASVSDSDPARFKRDGVHAGDALGHSRPEPAHRDELPGRRPDAAGRLLLHRRQWYDPAVWPLWPVALNPLAHSLRRDWFSTPQSCFVWRLCRAPLSGGFVGRLCLTALSDGFV